MSSLLTNSSAMIALQNLAATQKSLATTQSQISSGLAVANASDNAAYWSISTSLKSDTSALGAVTSALNLGASVVSTATSAMNSVETILKQMKDDIVTAQTAGTNKAQVQSDIAAQQQSLISIMSSASFNGVNLLDGSSSNPKIVSSFSRNADQTTTTNFQTINTTNTILSGSTGILGASVTGLSGSKGNFAGGTDSTAGTGGGAGTTGTPGGNYAQDSVLGFDLTNSTSDDLTALQAGIENAISKVTTAGASLGATTTTINNQLTYTSSLSDAITSGVGSLVDADMNVASTRLQALQTQQQLGIQALSVANQNSQLILKLFQG